MSRNPSAALVIDANIVLSAVLGRATRQHLAEVAHQRSLLISAETRLEVATVLAKLNVDADRLLLAGNLLSALDGPDFLWTDDALSTPSAALRDAVASRDASARDAHVLAVAWLFDADIWSHDRDFAGTGWPSWSTGNLVAALRDDSNATPDR
jgi:predicted nucleic acid-binding protein